MPFTTSRKEAKDFLRRLAREGNPPRIWIGADPSGDVHLGHYTTMLYGFTAAAEFAEETGTPVDFILALNDQEVSDPRDGENLVRDACFQGRWIFGGEIQDSRFFRDKDI
ncbi:MAG: hypothetical protein V1820_06795 [archaeon]